MAEAKCREYLAARVLAQNKPVTYRLLSRALQVNVNLAKRMLFDFQQKQNAKGPNSIHATYLVTGTPRALDPTNGLNDRDGEDAVMRSSPFPSSMPEPEESVDDLVKKTVILLVREEELEKTRAELEDELSIHIYSLEPGPIEDLNILSTCNHEIHTEYADADPMQRWKTYGSIQNSHIKRRTAKYAPPPAATKAPAKPLVKPTTKIKMEGKDTTAPAHRGSASEDNASGASTPQPSGSSSSLKKPDTKFGSKKDKTVGDIFKSFAKAKSKPKEANTSQQSTPNPVEDEPMQGMSEDEGDANEESEIKIDHEKNEAARKAREDRAEKLRKMMEDDDEQMPDAATPIDSQSEVTPAATQDAPEADEAEPTVTVVNGRRRGRRRVMKKKKVKDEDGYLVTKEEAVWESFSEEEPEAKKLKPAPTKPGSTAKGKTGGKHAQGSIASFFKKS